jgi:hypothetical protein
MSVALRLPIPALSKYREVALPRGAGARIRARSSSDNEAAKVNLP